MKHYRFLAINVFTLLFFTASCQSLKDKMKAKIPTKDNSEIYECGYVHVDGLKEKMNPMKALQKGIAGGVTNGSNPDLGTAAISVFYQAHLHPQSIMKYPTKTPGWETCGDAVFAGFTNRSGAGLSSTDGDFMMGDSNIAYSGAGTYFKGFSPEKRGKKNIKITSSNGDVVKVDVEPGMPLEIKSIDGKPKGEPVDIDGTKDIVIELTNGDADKLSNIHVQLVCKLVGTPIIYDVIVTKARNKIIIPKDAFKNFEGSPSPFIKSNTLIVNRVRENVIEGTSAGAIRTISAYMDWAPVTVSGDLSKGNVLTMGFDTTKNTNIKIDLQAQGEYSFTCAKDGPYLSPPIKVMKKVAIASFVVRGNTMASQTSTSGDWIIKTKKWFPQYTDQTWQNLVDKMYQDFAAKLTDNFDMEILPLDQVVNAKSYKYAKTIQDGASKTFVEAGAGGTKRILTTRSTDVFKDLSITFPSDFVSERLVKELDVDAVIAVTIDLDFNFETEGLDPTIRIVAFAPNVSYKTSAQYFNMLASTPAKSLKDSKQGAGSAEDIIYTMINADAFTNNFVDALKKLSAEEDAYPVYENLWKAKL